jgi:hypothetical protein
MSTNSQAGQDLFVIWALNGKLDGHFLEIGANSPIVCNNTYLLERDFGWSGLMIEYNGQYEPEYVVHRKNSQYIIADAQKISYTLEFNRLQFPQIMDYLQIDLEVDNASTINVLELIERQLFSAGYIFGAVTFEHDIYRGDFFNTREWSRTIFRRNGYVLLFGDVMHSGNAFEDWYVHPSHPAIRADFADYINAGPTEYSAIIEMFKKK